MKEDVASHGLAIIHACREIVRQRQHKMIAGCIVDMQTANAIVVVWDNINPKSRQRFLDIGDCDPAMMGAVAFSTLARARQVKAAQ